MYTNQRQWDRMGAYDLTETQHVMHCNLPDRFAAKMSKCYLQNSNTNRLLDSLVD